MLEIEKLENVWPKKNLAERMNCRCICARTSSRARRMQWRLWWDQRVPHKKRWWTDMKSWSDTFWWSAPLTPHWHHRSRTLLANWIQFGLAQSLFHVVSIAQFEQWVVVVVAVTVATPKSALTPDDHKQQYFRAGSWLLPACQVASPPTNNQSRKLLLKSSCNRHTRSAAAAAAVCLFSKSSWSYHGFVVWPVGVVESPWDILHHRSVNSPIDTNSINTHSLLCNLICVSGSFFCLLLPKCTSDLRVVMLIRIPDSTHLGIFAVPITIESLSHAAYSWASSTPLFPF